MDKVSDKEDEVACVLILMPDLQAARVLDIVKPARGFLAYRGREIYQLLKGLDPYVCTYIPWEVPPGAKTAGPLKFLELCGGHTGVVGSHEARR